MVLYIGKALGVLLERAVGRRISVIVNIDWNNAMSDMVEVMILFVEDRVLLYCSFDIFCFRYS